MKQVRINDKTVIEVDESIPDDQARKVYLEKLIKKPGNNRGGWNKGNKRDKTGIIKNSLRSDIVFKGDNVHKRQNR